MATKITRDVLESFLNCTYKAHLKLAGQQDGRSEHQLLLADVNAEARERTTYVTQRQAVADAKVQFYLDVEGLPDPDRYYLIGLLVVEGESSRRHSFWADRPADEAAIWESFLG